MDSSEYWKQVSAFNRIITEAKFQHDHILTFKLTKELEALKEAYRKAESEARSRAADIKVREALAFAPIIQEKYESLRDSYARTPKPHQISGAIQLASAGSGILADEPRLGKTFASHIWAELLDIKRLLVFCPNEVQSTFVSQYLKDHTVSPPVVKLGQMTTAQREATLDFILEHTPTEVGFIVVLNYESVRRDSKATQEFINKLISLRFQGLICDESHNINKTITSTFQAIQKIRSALNWCPRHHDLYSGTYPINLSTGHSKLGCSDCKDFTDSEMESSIKYVLMMTATPILNRPQELYPQLKLCFPTEFSKETQFLYDYCFNYGGGRWRWAYGGETKLFSKLGPRLVQRKASDAGIEIPPQDTVIHEIEFDPSKYPEQARVLEQITKYSSVILNAAEDVMPIPSQLAAITRLRQAVTWPGGMSMPCGRCDDCFSNPLAACKYKLRLEVYESQKLDAVETFIRENANGPSNRMVVFSQFKDPLHELHRRLSPKLGKDCSVVFDGDTTPIQRDEIKEDFLYKGSSYTNYHWQVLLANTRTGGTGLDLAGANIICVIDEEWNPGKGEQRDHRIINMDKAETTQVNVFRQLRSIDDFMAELIEGKKDINNQFEDARRIIDRLAQKFLIGT